MNSADAMTVTGATVRRNVKDRTHSCSVTTDMSPSTSLSRDVTAFFAFYCHHGVLEQIMDALGVLGIAGLE